MEIFLFIIFFCSNGILSADLPEITENFLINTNKCKIVDLPPFGPEAPLFSTNISKPSCSNFSQLLTYTTVDLNVAKLHVRQELFPEYFGQTKNITCCYKYVYKNSSKENPDVGVSVSECHSLENMTELQHDLLYVSCGGHNLSNSYNNVHQVIKKSERISKKARNLLMNTRRKPISVLFVIIDSISRLNFIRTMPKTRSFLLQNNFYEFKGYNKVHDNTYKNVIPLLTGMNFSDSIETCRLLEIDGLMKCPLIWYDYRDLGYVTAYAEDWAELATFNYNAKGFLDQPTDYYFKPYMDALSLLKTQMIDSMPFCAGPESQGDRILRITYDFAKTLKNIPTFGMFWMNTFSHNNITSPRYMDETVKGFIKKLKTSGILDESIVILLSDHGIRYGDILNTTRGFYELRLPLNYISLPKWFKKMYPVKSKNFRENANKLTSNYDLYMTLQHILTLSGTNYIIQPSRGCPLCKSLFEEIATDRSCFEAGIPSEWCTCKESFGNSTY